MTSLAALWLPLLLSSVLVFIVSSLIHMMTPWHKSDYPKLPDEKGVRDALRPFAIPPGDYFFPCPSSHADMRSEEFKQKLREGPRAVMTLMPNEIPSIGKNLIGWFIYSLVVGLFAAYIASRALPEGAPYLSVFRFVGAVAFVGYSLALWQMSIWYQRSVLTTIKSTIDGLIYGLLTAGMFGWLWPR